MSGFSKVLDSKAATWGVVAIVAAVALYVVGKKLAGALPGAVASVGNAVNPVNPDNIFAGSVNAVGGALAGSPDWSLGSWIYDLLNPAYDPNATTDKAPKPAGGTEAPFGDSWSLGSWAYDLLHPDYDPNADTKTNAAANYRAADWIGGSWLLGG